MYVDNASHTNVYVDDASLPSPYKCMWMMLAIQMYVDDASLPSPYKCMWMMLAIQMYVDDASHTNVCG